MKVKFKCTLSGNTVEFEHDHDIKDMRNHPQYVEVFEDGTTSPEKSDMDRAAKPKRKLVKGSSE